MLAYSVGVGIVVNAHFQVGRELRVRIAVLSGLLFDFFAYLQAQIIVSNHLSTLGDASLETTYIVF